MINFLLGIVLVLLILVLLFVSAILGYALPIMRSIHDKIIGGGAR